MRVYLVQHGDAVPKEVDPDRPLTDTGRRDIERLAKFLNAAKVRVSRIIHSGKTRAQQTAEILAKDSGRNVNIDAMSGLNPDDPPMKFAKQIEEIDAGAVIISHLPFLSLLVSHLVADDGDQPVVSFQTRLSSLYGER
jgi:phosphohistidine phosphatase